MAQVDTEEDKINTDANLADTDGDGLADGDEVNVFQSSPFTAHSDNDNFDDGKELNFLTSPRQSVEPQLQSISQ